METSTFHKWADYKIVNPWMPWINHLKEDPEKLFRWRYIYWAYRRPTFIVWIKSSDCLAFLLCKKNKVISIWLNREKTCWFWKGEDSRSKAKDVHSWAEVERCLQWKFHRKDRYAMEHCEQQTHATVNINTTHNSCSWELEEIPGSESNFRL